MRRAAGWLNCVQDWKLLGTSFTPQPIPSIRAPHHCYWHFHQHVRNEQPLYLGVFLNASSSRGLGINWRISPFMMHHQKESRCPICDYRAGSQECCTHLTPLPYLFLQICSLRWGYTRKAFGSKVGSHWGFLYLQDTSNTHPKRPTGEIKAYSQTYRS